MKDFFMGKTILIIGGTGTVGRKIVELLLKYEPKVIRIFSRDEYKQFVMQNEVAYREKTRFLIGDVRDYDRVLRASKDLDIIFHLAAMKHVPACEYDPMEAVKTNVIGTQNVINAAIENQVKTVVFTSSDKAISPTNAMGATKLLAERLIIASEYSKGPANTIFTAVRFGNVLGSRGSVIPLFMNQILDHRRITLTNGDMTRFMMSVSDAAALTIKAAKEAKGGEVFVLKMPIIKLNDLAEVVIEKVCEKYGISKNSVKIENVGLRPGEKMYEELMTSEEAENVHELQDMYAILPVFQISNSNYEYENSKKTNKRSYTSLDQAPISKKDLHALISREEII